MPPDTQQEIPKGLATKLGVGGGVVLAILAVLAEVFDVTLDTETLAGLAGSVVLLVTTMVGRYQQAAAKYKNPALADELVSELDEFEDFVEDLPDEEPPAEAELVQDYPEPPPTVQDVPVERRPGE